MLFWNKLIDWVALFIYKIPINCQHNFMKMTSKYQYNNYICSCLDKRLLTVDIYIHLKNALGMVDLAIYLEKIYLWVYVLS